jgi:hypothetical protein
LLTGERNEMKLSHKCVRDREIAVVRHEDAADHGHRIVRRGNLRHSPLHGSLPARAADEEVAGLGPRRAFADVVARFD